MKLNERHTDQGLLDDIVRGNGDPYGQGSGYGAGSGFSSLMGICSGAGYGLGIPAPTGYYNESNYGAVWVTTQFGRCTLNGKGRG